MGERSGTTQILPVVIKPLTIVPSTDAIATSARVPWVATGPTGIVHRFDIPS